MKLNLLSNSINHKTILAIAITLTISACNDTITRGPTPDMAPIGILDINFDSDGIVLHNSAAGGNGDEEANAAIIDSSGKIIVAGNSINSLGDWDLAVWRFNSDGSLDLSFGSNGFVTHAAAAGGVNEEDYGTAITLDSTGKILVAGSSVNSNGSLEMTVWRFNDDGTLDTSFDSDGFVTHIIPGDTQSRARAITIDSNNKILLSGYTENPVSNDDMALWRLNADGTFDTTLNSTGYVSHDAAAGSLNSNDRAESIAIDANGKITLAGYSENTASNRDMALWRFNTNGTLDTSLSTDGIAINHNAAGGASDDEARALVIQGDGSILVAGSSTNTSTDQDMTVWRFNTAGALDVTFNSTGYLVNNGAAGGSDFDAARAIALDPDGNILISGFSHNGANLDMTVWRVSSNGSLDTSFNIDGIFSHDAAAGASGADGAFSILITSSDRIITAGQSFNGTNNDLALWALK